MLDKWEESNYSFLCLHYYNLWKLDNYQLSARSAYSQFGISFYSSKQSSSPVLNFFPIHLKADSYYSALLLQTEICLFISSSVSHHTLYYYNIYWEYTMLGTKA